MRTSAARIPSTRPVAAIGGFAVLACAAWAFWPLPRPKFTTPDLTPATTESPAERVLPPLDLAAFRAPLWVAPPPPPVAAAPPPPPPPLKLQLIAIVREAEVYKAALYDPDQDKLFIVGKGETIAGRTIEEVRAGDLTLKDNGISRTLALKTEGDKP